MGVERFLDTNVLLYQLKGRDTPEARIPLGVDDVRRYLQSVLAPLLRIQPTLRLFHASLDIRVRYRFGYCDSLIVAAALDAGCATL